MQNSEKLKPCPFCGGEAELRQEDFDPRWMPTRNDPDSGGCPPYYVKCDDCGASTEYRYAYPDAVELWNRRSDENCTDDDTAEWIYKEVRGTMTNVCSVCGSCSVYPDKYCGGCGRSMKNGY